MAIQNSGSIAKLIARELRAGNRLKECGECQRPRITKKVGLKHLCVECAWSLPKDTPQ